MAVVFSCAELHMKLCMRCVSSGNCSEVQVMLSFCAPIKVDKRGAWVLL